MPLSLEDLQTHVLAPCDQLHNSTGPSALNTACKCLQDASRPREQGMQALFAAVLGDIYELEAETAGVAGSTGVDGVAGGPPHAKSAVMPLADGKLKRSCCQ